ncbi:unnamed protein product [Staurois parvus]|uniref:Secreted protein n=1 Tax=Staurois parvus TaxID=386267 RepID=A0ABN9DJB5_9NEOB|nr:unnamed protein product [Staurois parvus]
MLSLVCIAKGFFFSSSREGACDQHRANQHCPDRGSEVSHPPRAERKLLLLALTRALLNSAKVTRLL